MNVIATGRYREALHAQKVGPGRGRNVGATYVSISSNQSHLINVVFTGWALKALKPQIS
jgi:hypothetical protein